MKTSRYLLELGQKINGVEVLSKADGSYYNVKCLNCGSKLRLRADNIHHRSTRKCKQCPKSVKATSYGIDAREIKDNPDLKWLTIPWR